MGSLLFEPFLPRVLPPRPGIGSTTLKSDVWCLVRSVKGKEQKSKLWLSVHQTDDFNCKCTIFVVLSAFHLLSSSRSLTHSVHLLLIRSKQIITAGCCLCCVALHMLELLLSADTKLYLQLFPAPTPPEIPRCQCHSPLTLILLVKFYK